jgi:RNA polymerase-binding transcription factor DksA
MATRIDEGEARNRLVAKQTELQRRIAGTEGTERREVAEGQNDNAQLWEVSDVRDDLDSQAATELEQVNQALARLDAGEYGLCMDCEEPIAEARLNALPYATLCIQCAEEAEQSS